MNSRKRLEDQKYTTEIATSNSLAQSGQRMNKNAKLLYYFLIMNIDARRDDFGIIKFPLRQFHEYSGIGMDQLYRTIESLSNELYELDLKLRISDDDWERSRLLTGIKYKDGFIEYRFNEDMKPHLLKQQERFMTLNPALMKNLNSFYSMHLYDILKADHYKMDKREYVEYSLEQFRKFFQLKDEEYKEFRDLRKRVIDPAISDINQHTDMTATWEPVKVGKKYGGLRFRIEVDKNFNTNNDGIVKFFMQMLKDNGEMSNLREQCSLSEDMVTDSELARLFIIAGEQCPSASAVYLKRTCQNIREKGVIPSTKWFNLIKNHLESDYYGIAKLARNEAYAM